MTVAIYSALYGGYDTVKELPDMGVPAYLFTDQAELNAPGWTVVHRPHHIVTRRGPVDLLAPMLAHKYWKCHPGKAISQAQGDDMGASPYLTRQFETLDREFVSIWLDASITPEPGFVDKALAALGDDDWAMVPHPWRTCIYTEADYSAGLHRYAGLADQIRAQAGFYRTIGHPDNWGLFATGVNARRHTALTIEVGEQWWQDIINHTHQDQISLPVLARIYSDDARLQRHRLRWNTNIGWTEGWQLCPHLK